MMIRVPAICLFLLLFSSRSLAQFGNEWINHDQQFVKIPVAKDGLYKVSFSSLVQAGLNVSEPAKLQLFHRGQEV
ncbi:MAG TPA: hypothetical protein VEB86_05435, partial [Chryseosolibacter sp.]|nr:hypothetical protein [Chryseosolibacter sp.]